MWAFDKIRRIAIHEMSQFKVDPVEKYLLGKQYDVAEWLVPALNELAQREKPMGINDVERLGLDCVLKVAEVRESLVLQLLNAKSSSYGGKLVVGERGHLNLDFGDRVRMLFGLQ